MLFNDEECILIVSALETYDESDQTFLPPELKHRLILSSLEKISNLSTLTYFTKQEFTVMYAAVDHIIRSEQQLGQHIDNDLMLLSNKIYDLALPSGN